MCLADGEDIQTLSPRTLTSTCPRHSPTLTVPGRRTGRARPVPVVPVEVGGIRYLVSPYGESDWARNLRAAGKATLTRKGKVETFQASEVTVPGRAAIIAAYRKVCGRAVDL